MAKFQDYYISYIDDRGKCVVRIYDSGRVQIKANATRKELKDAILTLAVNLAERGRNQCITIPSDPADLPISTN
jgi:hypothetical protein